MNLSEESLNQKIINYSNSIGAKDVNRVRTTLALERIVARLRSVESLSEKLIFCGGFVLYKEGVTDRYTKDVDMISTEKDHEKVIRDIQQAIEMDLGDGFWFGDTLIEEILDDVLYGGIRFRPSYKIGLPLPDKSLIKKLRKIHLDVSFQSTIGNIGESSDFKSELDLFEKVSWKIYPFEYIAADKIHAILSRVGLSTRSKDVYDLSYILPKCDKLKLRKALSYTFHIRAMELVEPISNSFKNIDTLLIQNNWKKIDFRNKSKSFEECWKEILSYLDSFR